MTVRLLVGLPGLHVPDSLSWGGHAPLPQKICRFLPGEGTTLGAHKRPYPQLKGPAFAFLTGINSCVPQRLDRNTRIHTAYLISIISFTCKFTLGELVHLAPGSPHYVQLSGNHGFPLSLRNILNK